MNERIRELAKQAAEHAETYGDTHDPIWWQFYNERFAELIVRECIKLNDANINHYHHELMVQKYKEHFGVES